MEYSSLVRRSHCKRLLPLLQSLNTDINAHGRFRIYIESSAISTRYDKQLNLHTGTTVTK